MKKPILTEVYTDNGDLSHYRLICPETGDNLWSSFPEEDKALGFEPRVVGQSEPLVCNNCGCPEPKKTYDGYWCKMCHNEM